MEQKTHWKVLQHPDYLGAYALMKGDENIELNVTIDTVKREMVTGADGKKEECTVAHLKGHKPMILNVTNQKAIAKALVSPYIEDWAGKSVTLYVAKVKAFGDTVDALRVKSEAPVIKKAEFNESHPKWNGAIKAIKAGNTTIDDIKRNYTLTPENEKLLCELSKLDAAQSAA